MAKTHTLGRIVPEKLIPIFESSNPDSTRAITYIMSRIFSDYQYWDYWGNISNGLAIECKGKPTKNQLQALFNRVEAILPHYPVLDFSDTITYEEYLAHCEQENEKDDKWWAGDGYDFMKSHQKHNERHFAEYILNKREVAKC